MRLMNKAVSALAAAGIAAVSLIAIAPTASAAGCVTTGITTGYQDIGTVAYKANSGCSDLNLTYADAKDDNWECYFGMYKNAAGVWTDGASGYHCRDDGWYGLDEVVLVTDLTPGRAFSVGAFSYGGDYVQITH